MTYKTLFRSEDYDEMQDHPFACEETMTGAELSALHHRLAQNDVYVKTEFLVDDIDIDFNADYYVTSIEVDYSPLTSTYSEIEVRKLTRY